MSWSVARRFLSVWWADLCVSCWQLLELVGLVGWWIWVVGGGWLVVSTGGWLGWCYVNCWGFWLLVWWSDLMGVVCCCVDQWVACVWLGNPWVCVCWLVLVGWYGAGRAGGLGGELRGLALIVFLQRVLGTLGHVIPWFLEGSWLWWLHTVWASAWTTMLVSLCVVASQEPETCRMYGC